MTLRSLNFESEPPILTVQAGYSKRRHSDINLPMNTYTMLGVLGQVAAVETLPTVPESKGPRLRAA